MSTNISRARSGGQGHAVMPHALAVALAIVLAGAGQVQAQDTAAGARPAAADPATLDAITVTARKREETLADVPVAITAVGQETLDRSGLESVADIAPFVPGLNVNSDSAGRAFISIRGIGTALQAGVQPGVGIFQDGIYQRETSYVNNPLLDIERIEVLRGPQGTLYGKNTLGGAINIITREPGNVLEGRVSAGYAEGDDSRDLGFRISGPVAGDRLRGKLAVSSRESDGFFRNRLTGDNATATSSDQASLSLVWDVGEATTVTGSAYHLDFDGPGTYYSHVDGPTDHRDNIQLNESGRQAFIYQGANVKVEFPLGERTNATTILAWDSRELESSGDGDFLALDLVRARGSEDSRTVTGEVRLDTQWTDTFSTLVGLYSSREDVDATTVQAALAAGVEAYSYARREGKTHAVFGTAIWRFAEDWELSAGLRLDREDRRQDTSTAVSVLPGVITPQPRQSLDSTEVQPRVSLTRFLDNGWMVYGSVAKGYRGGGFNAAGVPAEYATYGGDTVWTYETGAKLATRDGRYQWSNALYYNDYTDSIGQNALVPGPGGGPISIDLNLGDVEAYGLETELLARVTSSWTLNAAASLMHARITDQSGWIALTGGPLATDRLLFQPDWNVSLGSTLSIPAGAAYIDWNLGMVAKGSRPGSSFDPVTPSILDSYMVWNTSLTWNREAWTVGLYVNNLFDEKYFESYIDGSLLSTLGLLDQNLGIIGAPRNVGIRMSYDF